VRSPGTFGSLSSLGASGPLGASAAD